MKDTNYVIYNCNDTYRPLGSRVGFFGNGWWFYSRIARDCHSDSVTARDQRSKTPVALVQHISVFTGLINKKTSIKSWGFC